jgi:hypothetical protein
MEENGTVAYGAQQMTGQAPLALGTLGPRPRRLRVVG